MSGTRALLLVGALAVGLGGCETLRRQKVEPVAPSPTVIAPPPVLQLQPPPSPAPAPATPRACVPRNLSPPPRYPDTDKALREAPGAADRYQLMAAGRLMRERRLQELERIVAGCR